MTDRELMQQALDALEEAADHVYCPGDDDAIGVARKALRAALAQPEHKPADVFLFLLGEGELDGVGFGDPHPTERGNYWWRKHLRAALAQPEQEPVALGDSSYDVDFRDDGAISVSLPDGDELVIVPPQPKQKDLEPYCYTWDKWISSGTWEAQYGWKPYYGGKRPEHVTDAKPLYTAPPQREWQGLTDEERTFLAWESNNGPECVAMTEAKLKEKNA